MTSEETTPVLFEDLGLMPALVEATVEMGFKHATSIQANSIPPALEGRDILGAARTGSGKTAAFTLPILQRLCEEGIGGESKQPFALVLSPTRELALQIEETFEALSVNLEYVYFQSIVGGMPFEPQIAGLEEGPQVVIATPGRLLDHAERRNVDLSKVKLLVLDEADRMLDMGFEEQIDAIMRRVSPDRQTLLFSATIEGASARLAKASVNNPFHVDVTDEVQEIPDVEISWDEILESEKRGRLIELIEEEEGTMLVFCSTRQNTRLCAKMINKAGYTAGELHSGLDQKQRSRSLKKFREGTIRILVATDVAARGIDVDNIAHVVNFDMPYSPEDFVHRIGRTARAGRKGKATNFVTVGDRETVKQVLRLLDLKQEAEAEPKKAFGRRMKRARPRKGAPTKGSRLF